MFNNFSNTEIYKAIVSEQWLGNAVTLLHGYLDEHHLALQQERLNAIEADYKRMQGFMLKGYEDSRRKQIYEDLLRRIYTLSVEAKMVVEYQKTTLYSVAQSHIANQNLSLENILPTCQRYVQDMAMLSLNEQGNAEESRAHIYRQHHQYLNALFESIVVGGLWNEAQQEFYSDLLCNPTVASSDILVLISAVTLSCVNFFDMHKMRVLHHVYLNALEKEAKQRAFCGMWFSLDSAIYLYDDADTIVETLSNERESLNLMLKLIARANNADRDVEKIQQEILPDLMDGQKKFFHPGSDLLNNSSLEEILNPDTDEELTHRIEQSMDKMNDMIQDGADLYFGGLAQSKRHPFFMSYQNTCNWFLPFDPSHPDLLAVVKTENGAKVLKALEHIAVLCDSDKYSLALRVESFLNQLPPEMFEMLSNSEIYGPSIKLSPSVEQNINPGYIQDLYRFYRLNQFQASFANPFEVKTQTSALSFTFLYLYKDDDFLAEILKYFFKNKLYDYLDLFFKACPSNDRFDINKLHGDYLLVTQDVDGALAVYEKLYERNPMSRSLRLAMAICYFRKQQYDKSIVLYRELLAQDSKSEMIGYNLAYSLFWHEEYEEAAKLLYQINYEHPENTNVQQLLVKSLLGLKSVVKAKELIQKMLDMPSPISEVYLLMGYIHAIEGNISQAIESFKSYDGDVLSAIRHDETILILNFPSLADLQILCDILKYGSSE